LYVVSDSQDKLVLLKTVDVLARLDGDTPASPTDEDWRANDDPPTVEDLELFDPFSGPPTPPVSDILQTHSHSATRSFDGTQLYNVHHTSNDANSSVTPHKYNN
jgi:hypothetical protein